MQHNIQIFFSILPILLSTSVYPLFGQTISVRGTVLDSVTQKPIGNANVVVKDQRTIIIEFAITDFDGRFSISVQADLPTDTFYLEASNIGYNKKSKKIDRIVLDYKFELLQSASELPDVEVKALKPVVIKEDTLSYNVDYFAQAADRSIGDVIKRIPGMAVDGTGRISYNGLPISNLYIQGDDLMDGRYGAATKTINKDHIKSIDVLLNYQPINVLRSKVHTDDVAINLTLKDPRSLKMSGQAMAGAGLPAQYDGEVSAILFNEKIKMLNAAKANNSSVDYEGEITDYNQQHFLNEAGTRQTSTLLSSALANPPNVPKPYYYLNRSALVNLNNLVNTRDSLQIKTNLQWFTDRNDFSFASQINNLLPSGDTIAFNQRQQAERQLTSAMASITLQYNTHKAYLTNRSRVNYRNENEGSELGFNQNAFTQNLATRQLDISNNFTFIPATREKNMVQLKWFTQYRRVPQHLDINTGIDSNTLNNGKAYDALRQDALLPSFFSNASLSYIKLTKSHFTQTYEVKAITDLNELQSGIILTQKDGTTNAYIGDPGNELRWARHLFEGAANYTYRKEAWQANVSLPLTWQHIQFTQSDFPKNAPNARLIFNPSARFSFFVNPEDKISLSYKYNNHFGDIQNIYQGLIVPNFRWLNTNSPVLQESNNSSISLRYDVRRAIKLFTANTQLKYNKISANTLLSSVLNNNIQQTILLPFQNDQSRLSASGEMSKYFFKLKSKLGLMGMWSRMYQNQFLNGSNLRFANDVYSLSAQMEGTMRSRFAYQYMGGITTSNSRQRNTASPTGNLQNSFTRFEQDIMLGYNYDNLFLSLRGRQVNAWQSTLSPVQFFSSDVGLRYKIQKWKADLSFDLTNMFNVEEYVLFSVSSNQFIIDRYPIRSRMAIVRMTFGF